MEGMVALGGREIQADYMRTLGLRGSAHSWASELSTKLLECTHGQWLYRNVMVHDKESGRIITQRKEEILQEITTQLANADSLSDEDQYLLEINVGDMTSSSGEEQEYWMLAIRAARRAKILRAQLAEGIG